MLYNKHEAERLQRSLLLISCAAMTISLLPSLPGTVPVAAICGSGLITGSAIQWLMSVSGGWALMIVAMMMPTLVQPLMHVRVSSFVDRRWRSSALFVVSYATIWLVAGMAISLVELIEKRMVTGASLVVIVNMLVAFVWQVSPLKQRCLNRGHAHPALSAFGRQADKDALHFGIEHGFWCIGSCWALMLAAASLERWHLLGMLAVGILMYCERLDPPASIRWRVRGLRTAHLRIRHAVRVFHV